MSQFSSFPLNSRSVVWFAYLSSSHFRSALSLATVSLLCFLPGFFSLPAIDRDEARYAQASRQMVESGDWVDIRLQEVPRHKQPAGIYWAQSFWVTLLGNDCIAPIWVHRLTSLIAATTAVLLTYWIALPLVGSGPAILAGLVMAGSIILGVEARLAKTDATLLAATLACKGVLARAYLAEKSGQTEHFSWKRAWWLPLLFWTALAAGSLVKGPLTLLFIGLTVLTLAVSERSGGFLRRLRPLPGLLWFLVLVLPWYIAIGLQTDGAFYKTAVGFSILGKISQGHEGHGAPPLTHFAWFWGIFWPGSLLFALALAGIWNRRKEVWMKFLICWTIPSWLAFELITTKLPHYLLPVFPAIAIATAGVLTSLGEIFKKPLVHRTLITISILLSVSAFLVVTGAAWFASGEKISIRLVIFAVISLALFGLVFRGISKSLRQQNLPGLYAALAAGVMSLYWLLYPSVASIPLLWPAPAVAKMIEAGKKCDTPFLVSAGYHEASLVFATRTDLVMTYGADAAVQMAGRECAIAIIEDSQKKDFLAKQSELGLELEEIGELTGFNIGGGRMLNLTLLSSTKGM